MIRPMVAADHVFVKSSWAKSFSFSDWAGPWTNDEYWGAIKPKLDGLLAKPGVEALVYCNPQDQDQILGYACYEKGHDFPVLHWAYVKHPFRDHNTETEKPRIALKLLRQLGMADGAKFLFTFRTAAWDRYRQSHRLNAKFTPAIVRGYHKPEREGR